MGGVAKEGWCKLFSHDGNLKLRLIIYAGTDDMPHSYSDDKRELPFAYGLVNSRLS